MSGGQAHGREAELRAEVAFVCNRLYDRGLIAGADGNVSARLGPDRVLATPAGWCKGDVTPNVLVVTDGHGIVMGDGRPSSELQMHLRIYEQRPDVMAVVHAHPPVATGFAVAGQTIAPDVLPEIIFQVGDVALVPFAMPGTRAVADALDPYLEGHDAFLLANHGATTVGSSLRDALFRMETLEHAARILLAARQVGAVHPLDPEAVRTLREARSAAHGNRQGGMTLP
jgi:L-fuculose-phosphate aldolase